MNYKDLEDSIIESTMEFAKEHKINIGLSQLQIIQNALRELKSKLPYEWLEFDFNDLAKRPPKYDKYFVMRKDGKVHWETWNGSGWAYNGNVITHFCEIRLPKDSIIK